MEIVDTMANEVQTVRRTRREYSAELKAQVVQAIADPEHPEHGDMAAWIGHPFDPNAFNVQDAQDRLYEIKL